MRNKIMSVMAAGVASAMLLAAVPAEAQRGGGGADTGAAASAGAHTVLEASVAAGVDTALPISAAAGEVIAALTEGAP